jgi:hypothetical protein
VRLIWSTTRGGIQDVEEPTIDLKGVDPDSSPLASTYPERSAESTQYRHAPRSLTCSMQLAKGER